MREIDLAMRERTAQELRKLGGNHIVIAERANLQSNQVQLWLNGDATPSAGSLRKLHYAGLDVLYILTGERLLSDIPRLCDTCAHYCHHECEDECRDCGRSHICRTCHSYANWYWHGFTKTTQGGDTHARP